MTSCSTGSRCASATFSSPTVGFGFHEANGVWTSTRSVTLTNVSGGGRAYALSVAQGASTEVSWSVSPARLAVRANGSATFR